MAFCTNCGRPLRNEKDKFCIYCGAPLKPVSSGKPSDGIRGDEKARTDAEKAKADAERNRSYSERTQTYAGRVIKCPNCGEVLESFKPVCPACGYELRDTGNSSAVEEFTARLGRAVTERERITVIRDFPIPNTKEDVLEFAILASTNINENRNLDDEVSDAWFAKLGQAYQKAQLLFGDQPEYERVKSLYEHVEQARQREKSVKQTAGQQNAVPNIIVVTGWLLILFIIAPLCRDYIFHSGVTEVLTFVFVVDMIAGIFIIPRQCRCDSNAPKIIATAGTLLSIVLIIPLYIGGRYSYFDYYVLIMIVDIICTAVILRRAYKNNRSMQMDGFSVKVLCLCTGICLAVYVILWILVGII